MPGNLRLDAEAFQLAQVELALFAEETAIKRPKVLGTALRPGMADARDAELDRVAGVPLDRNGAVNRANHVQEAREQASVPVDCFARLKAFVAKVPALAVDLPGHHRLDIGGLLGDAFLESRHRLIEEGMEC